jgi:hypothetical protein
MKESLKQDLQSLICVGNIAKLPTDHLNNYPELKKTLMKACGKYHRNEFEFPFSAKAVVKRILTGENVDFKKEFQFFATPQELAERMADEIIFDKHKMDILEPSAGHGSLIDAVLGRNEDVTKTFDAIELSELNESILRDKYKHLGTQVLINQNDFLSIEFDKKYDLIIANPPFTKNQDIDHVRKMYSLLADNGQLITLSSKSWTFGSQRKQVEFKNWLEKEVGATFTDIEQGSFKSSGTNVAAMLITINR